MNFESGQKSSKYYQGGKSFILEQIWHIFIPVMKEEKCKGKNIFLV